MHAVHETHHACELSLMKSVLGEEVSCAIIAVGEIDNAVLLSCMFELGDGTGIDSSKECAHMHTPIADTLPDRKTFTLGPCGTCKQSIGHCKACKKGTT